MSIELETALQLLKLAQRLLDEGETAKAVQALSQAEALVTEAAKHLAQSKPQS